jgi:regulator of cell morphogenesis and NO signaling
MYTSNTKPAQPELNPSLTVNALIAWCPSVLPVLNGFGLDTCCGGAESLELAARAANVQLDDLMAGVSAAVERIGSLSPRATKLSPSSGVGQ